MSDERTPELPAGFAHLARSAADRMLEALPAGGEPVGLIGVAVGECSANRYVTQDAIMLDGLDGPAGARRVADALQAAADDARALADGFAAVDGVLSDPTMQPVGVDPARVREMAHGLAADLAALTRPHGPGAEVRSLTMLLAVEVDGEPEPFMHLASHAGDPVAYAETADDLEHTLLRAVAEIRHTRAQLEGTDEDEWPT